MTLDTLTRDETTLIMLRKNCSDTIILNRTGTGFAREESGYCLEETMEKVKTVPRTFRRQTLILFVILASMTIGMFVLLSSLWPAS